MDYERNSKLSYKVNVNYSASWIELLRLGQFSDIKNSPRRRPYTTPNSISTHVTDVQIDLLAYDGDLKSDEIITDMSARNLRVANMLEILSLAAQYPNLGRQFAILTLDYLWKLLPPYRVVPCIEYSIRGRLLTFCRYSTPWMSYPHKRFASIRVSKQGP
jgi:hypothetical protein